MFLFAMTWWIRSTRALLHDLSFVLLLGGVFLFVVALVRHGYPRGERKANSKWYRIIREEIEEE